MGPDVETADATSAEDEFAEAWQELEDYYLSGGLTSTTVEIGDETFLLERDGDYSRFDSLAEDPEPIEHWRRVPLSDDGKRELARRIREHLAAVRR